MGRHSSSEQGPYYASFARWALPWVLAVAVVGGAVFVAANVFAPDDTKPIAGASPSPSVTPSTTPSTPSPSPTKTPTPKPKPSKANSGALITKGISLQVLNASSDSDADDRVAEQLRKFGFEVVSVEDSLSSESVTRVYWARPEAQEAAQRLAERMGWVAEAQPDSLNLTAEVDMHVLVGEDEAN